MTPSTGRTEEATWLAVHLQVDCADLFGADLDAVVTNMVAPAVDRLRSLAQVDQYFFVRYNEGGNHLRVRLRAVVKDGASECIERVFTEFSRYPVIAVRREIYAPEFDRYGGPVAIHLAHDIFAATSDAAIRLLPHLTTKRPHRLGQGLLATLVLTRAFTNDNDWLPLLARFGHGFFQAFTPATPDSHLIQDAVRHTFAQQQEKLFSSIAEVSERLSHHCGVTSIMDDLLISARVAATRLRHLHSVAAIVVPTQVGSNWPDSAEWLLRSLVHMTNNRFGLHRLEELLLAHAVGEFARGSSSQA